LRPSGSPAASPADPIERRSFCLRRPSPWDSCSALGRRRRTQSRSRATTIKLRNRDTDSVGNIASCSACCGGRRTPTGCQRVLGSTASNSTRADLDDDDARRRPKLARCIQMSRRRRALAIGSEVWAEGFDSDSELAAAAAAAAMMMAAAVVAAAVRPAGRITVAGAKLCRWCANTNNSSCLRSPARLSPALTPRAPAGPADLNTCHRLCVCKCRSVVPSESIHQSLSSFVLELIPTLEIQS
jgi:hypothetical protein